jgi:hypothetical protein
LVNDQDRNALRQAQGARLREARERAGYREASEGARAAGVPIPTFHAHEAGDRSLVKNAEAYARAFNTDYRWLLTGEIVDRSAKGAVIPIKGTAGEGLWVNEATWEVPQGHAVPPSPDFPVGRQVAFLVAGSSASPFARDGTFLVAVPYADVRRGLKDGDAVVLQHRQGPLVEYVVRTVRCPHGEACKLEPIGKIGADEPIDATAPPAMHLVAALYRPHHTS